MRARRAVLALSLAAGAACGGEPAPGDADSSDDAAGAPVPATASVAIQLASLSDSMPARRLADSLSGEGWTVRVSEAVIAGRHSWRVRIVPPGNVGLPRLIAHALREQGRETFVVDDSGSAIVAPVEVHAVNRGTHGMMARVRWTSSPDGRTMLVVEDPAAVENDALPNGFLLAAERGPIVQRDSVWDVAPSPDWRRLAYARAYVNSAGERDSLSAADWRALAAQAGLDVEVVRAAAFSTSGMVAAYGVGRPAIIGLDAVSSDPRVESPRPDRLLPRAGGWRMRWSADGRLLAIGASPEMVQDDAPSPRWELADPMTGASRGDVPASALAQVRWEDGPTLDISQTAHDSLARTIGDGAAAVESRGGWIRVREPGAARQRIIGPGHLLTASRGGTVIVALAPNPDARSFESRTHLVVYRVNR